MKIGILSTYNDSGKGGYGCPLQSFALETFLRQNGFSAVMIPCRPVDEDTPGGEASNDPSLAPADLPCVRDEKIRRFMENHCRAASGDFPSELKEPDSADYDVLFSVTDTDQREEKGYCADRKRFAGGSVWTDRWPIAYGDGWDCSLVRSSGNEAEFLQYLNRIDRVSAKQGSVKQLMESGLSKRAALAADPLLMVDREVYEELLVRPCESRYLFYYHTGEENPELRDKASQFARDLSLKMIERTPADPDCGDGIEEWLGLLAGADLIFTDDYYGICLSIILEKPFFAGPDRDDRNSCLLDRLGLSERMVRGENPSETQIEYRQVRESRREWAVSSASFILDALREISSGERFTSEKCRQIPMIYNSGKTDHEVISRYLPEEGIQCKLESGLLEYAFHQRNLTNDGQSRIPLCAFWAEGFRFAGWHLRVCADHNWFWLLKDGTLARKEEELPSDIALLEDGQKMPFLNGDRISSAVAEAVWEEISYPLRVGIISINMYSKGLNFACPIHSYAFQQFLLKHGISSTILDYQPVYFDGFDMVHPADYYAGKETAARSRGDEKQANRYQNLFQSWDSLRLEREEKYRRFQSFILRNYHKTKEVYNSDLLEWVDPGMDVYICATDVIWKNQPDVGFDRGFFLASSVMENKWKIAYAASRGVYLAKHKEEEEQFFSYLSDFDYLAVREKSLADYISENSTLKAEVVLDPVLLHEKAFYERFAVKPPEEHYLLLYYVMENAKDTIHEAVAYAKAHNMLLVEITERPLKEGSCGQEEDLRHVFHYQIGVEEWLGYLMNADMVFTNSFHACCFSVLFGRQFYVGFRKGDKVAHFLESMGLSRRMFADRNEFREEPDISYEKVWPLLEKKRKQSSEYILNALWEITERSKTIKDYTQLKRKAVSRIYYNSNQKECIPDEELVQGPVITTPAGNLEYRPEKEKVCNDGTFRLPGALFHQEESQLLGWRIRFRIDNEWFWLLANGGIAPKNRYRRRLHGEIAFLGLGWRIPFLPVNRVSLIVAEGVWGCLGEKRTDVVCPIRYTGDLLEPGTFRNDGSFRIPGQGRTGRGRVLLGWHLKVQAENQWFWYLKSGEFAPCKGFSESAEHRRFLFCSGNAVPVLPAGNISLVEAKPVWLGTPGEQPFPIRPGVIPAGRRRRSGCHIG